MNNIYFNKNLIESSKEKYEYIITIEINKNIEIFDLSNNINDNIFFNILSSNNTKLNNINPECLTTNININKDTFINRIFEILSIKLFGDACYKLIFVNENLFMQIYNILFSQINNFLNKYKTELFKFNNIINEINIIFPFNFIGDILNLEDTLKVLFESSNYGGSNIIDGKYNILLLLEIIRTI